MSSAAKTITQDNKQTTNLSENELQVLNIDDIIPNPNQPRKNFNSEKLRELSESIKNSGLLQPILVSKIETGDGNSKYMIIAGERRYKASKMAGLQSIKAIILNLEEQEILKNAVLENVQRENLNPIEEATGYKRIIETFGYTHEKLAKEIGKSRAHITNLLRVLNLPEDVKSALENENITLGHAKVLLGVGNPNEYLPTIIEKQLSVRQLEKMIANGGVYEEEENSNASEKKTDLGNEKNNTADVTFEMIKQLYSPLINNNEDDESEINTDSLKERMLRTTNEEWKKVEENVRIIERQLSESCGFNIHLSLKKDGSGKLEVFFNDSDQLLELVRFFQ